MINVPVFHNGRISLSYKCSLRVLLRKPRQVLWGDGVWVLQHGTETGWWLMHHTAGLLRATMTGAIPGAWSSAGLRLYLDCLQISVRVRPREDREASCTALRSYANDTWPWPVNCAVELFDPIMMNQSIFNYHSHHTLVLCVYLSLNRKGHRISTGGICSAIVEK